MCSISAFRKHLESQFQPGMSWHNYGQGKGKWNIDHIIPCNFFNMLDPVEQHMCFNYTNTQPMWQVDNLSKSDKLAHVNNTTLDS
jgi:hypothetical protein